MRISFHFSEELTPNQLSIRGQGIRDATGHRGDGAQIVAHSAQAAQRCLQLTAARTIIGVSGIHQDAFYIARNLERSTKIALINDAGTVVVVATHQKMLRSAVARLAAFDTVDALVTDAPPPAEIETALRAAGVQVIVASWSARVTCPRYRGPNPFDDEPGAGND